MDETTTTTTNPSTVDAPVKERTAERTSFLRDLLIGAIESGGYGGLATLEYEPGDDESVEAMTSAYALVYEIEYHGTADLTIYRVDLDTIERAIEVIRKAVLRPTKSGYLPAGTLVLHNAETGKELGLSQRLADSILAAADINDASGHPDHEDLDVIASLALVEIDLFGAVVLG